MKAITFSRLITLAILFCTIVDAKNAGYYSQYGQDKFIHETFFSNKHDGIFVEVGASDGLFISNTYFFEKNLGWKGICIEPNPKLFSSLKKNRNCACYNCCILDCDDEKEFLLIEGFCEPLSGLVQNYHPLHTERIKREIKQFGGSSETIKVQCRTLNDIFEENNIYHVDYLSIDTEGSELEILKAIDFEQFNIDVISIEVNYDDVSAKDFLSSKGYTFVTNISGDEIYKKVPSKR